jgi:cytochrome c biogenesis protein CcmG, thiol:disulfide interchange protein DsbE
MPARLKLGAQALAVAAVLGLLAILIWKVAGGSGKTKEPQNFTLSRLNGPGKLELASLRGKVVVLNFFASWCAPCKQETPEVQRIWRQYRAQDVVVVGIDSKDFSGDARRFMRTYGITYPVVHDGEGKLWRPYGVTGLPETRIIDRKGMYVGDQFYGPVKAADLRRQLELALRS